MPYDTLRDLPSQVRENLPEGGQKIFKEAFNNAWDYYKDPKKRQGSDSREEVANKIAWSAVKKEYEKDPDSGEWTKRS